MQRMLPAAWTDDLPSRLYCSAKRPLIRMVYLTRKPRYFTKANRPNTVAKLDPVAALHPQFGLNTQDVNIAGNLRLEENIALSITQRSAYRGRRCDFIQQRQID